MVIIRYVDIPPHLPAGVARPMLPGADSPSEDDRVTFPGKSTGNPQETQENPPKSVSIPGNPQETLRTSREIRGNSLGNPTKSAGHP